MKVWVEIDELTDEAKHGDIDMEMLIVLGYRAMMKAWEAVMEELSYDPHNIEVDVIFREMSVAGHGTVLREFIFNDYSYDGKKVREVGENEGRC